MTTATEYLRDAFRRSVRYAGGGGSEEDEELET